MSIRKSFNLYLHWNMLSKHCTWHCGWSLWLSQSHQHQCYQSRPAQKQSLSQHLKKMFWNISIKIMVYF